MKSLYEEPLFYSATLKNSGQWQDIVSELKQRELPVHEDPPKNWDSYGALRIILHHFQDHREQISILDAGGEFYSSILPQLDAVGYRQLRCVNLTISEKTKIGNIEYEYGDIINLEYTGNMFNVVTCLSVIEHGVDVYRFLREMHRVLKPGGLLIISADYWEESIDTNGQMAFGHPFKIFDRAEMETITRLSVECGFKLIDNMDLDCNEKVINCLGLDYTFIFFTLQKMPI
jgi:SAM-dependent methyltransferase